MFRIIFVIFSVIFFNTTNAQNTGWNWQNPYPQGNALKSVSFVAAVADRGWAVGDKGTVIYTHDGGANWELVDVGTKENLNCVFMHDDEMIFITGDNGLVIFVFDNGGTFDITRQTSNTSKNLRSVTSNTNGCTWITGDSGIVLYSTNIGQTWTIQNTPLNKHFYSIHNIECTTAWVAGRDGYMMRTTNWGSSWEYIPCPTSQHLFSVNIGTFQHIRAVGNAGTMILTTNEGASWEAENCGTNSNLQDVFNFGYARSFAVGTDGVIIEKTDIADPWVQRNSGTRATLHDIEDKFGSDEMYVVGHYGTILKNSGTGTDFQTLNRGTMEWVQHIIFINENTGFAVGGDFGWSGTSIGMILKTTDGGESWDQDNISSPLNNIDFADEINGWIVGEDGKILHTYNAGAGWFSQTSPVNADLNDVCAVDEFNAWAVGDLGEIIHTSNAGGTWTRQNSTTPNWLYGVDFINTETGWAVGLDSTILRTTNGGVNWIRQNANASAGFRFTDVQFFDGMHGWVTGIYGSILLTTDGSATWHEIPSGTFASLASVCFSDLNNGWISGDAGIILRTRDCGFTWEQQYSPVASNTLTSVYFTDSLNGWASGEGGSIIHTTDGGGIVGIEPGENEIMLPEKFILYQNYPNPFNPVTTIKFDILTKSKSNGGIVTLKIYDILGKEISTLLNEYLDIGNYKITFDAGNLSSGMYFYRLQAGSIMQTKKMIIIR